LDRCGEQLRGKLRSPFQAGPEISPVLLATGGGQFSLNIDRSVKCSAQSRIVDPCNMPFENSCTPRIIEKQQPFANSAGPPILRTEMLHLISRHLGDRL
jgi:hypothetical protein